MKREILGLAMCGGVSSRMGSDKASLVVRPGMTQLEFALDILQSVCLRTAAGVGDSERALPPGIEAVFDEPNVPGPMAGVLAALKRSEGWPVLAIACDMPYLEVSNLVQIVNRRDPEKAATAFVSSDGYLEPMCAVYEPACLALLEKSIREKRFGLRRFLGRVDCERIALDRPDCLASVNSPEQLERARNAFSGFG